MFESHARHGLWDSKRFGSAGPQRRQLLEFSQSSRRQRTVSQAAVVTGFGYWRGRDVRVEFRPAEVDTGVVFVRNDLGSQARIPVDVRNRLDVPRRTVLSIGDVRVEMVEHILASLAGMQIDNCEVWVDAAEMPGCDGSSKAFVEALLAAGVVEQSAPSQQLVVDQIVRVEQDGSWIEARPNPGGSLVVEYRLDYGEQSSIPQQTARYEVTPETFSGELAACRTFLLKEEADVLLARGLGRRASVKDLLVYGPEGPIENTLRFPDECSRHKSLDMIGDLALAGCDLVANVVAYRSGHQLNARLVAQLLNVEADTSVMLRRRIA